MPIGYNKDGSNNGFSKGNIPWNKGKKGIQVSPNKGKHFSEEHKRKLRESNKGKHNFKHTKEAKIKIGNASRGRIFTEDHKRKLAISKLGNTYGLGRKVSEETKRRISEKNKISQLGRKHSSETKKKMSETRKGHLVSEKTRKKLSETHIKFWNKKGRNPLNRNKHQGEKYEKWRTKVFQRDNWICQTCQKRGEYLEAHHIKSWRNYLELRYKINNGITLCKKPCHRLANKEQRQLERERPIVFTSP